MHGDFTRNTFDAAKQYSRVLKQQGRVDLDADWNEQTAILLHYMRALTRDLFGAAAGPAEGCGFKIDKDGANLTIGKGRYYVGGIPVKNEGLTLFAAQVGNYHQDDFKPPVGGNVVYLDVWEQFVSYVQDDNMREVALGGPDACGRARIMWQVRLLDTGARLEDLPMIGTGQLSAKAIENTRDDQACVIAPDSRYRGAENQLYRVEIHSGGTAGGGATFKWSRDNGSVVFPIRTLKGSTVEVEHLGRDAASGLNVGDCVEIIDDAMAAHDGVGVLAQVTAVDRDELSVTLALPTGAPILAYPTPSIDLHPLLRRWDHQGGQSSPGAGLEVIPVEWLALEDGIQINFSKNGTFKAGDYWLIPARVATGDVEWPESPGNPDLPLRKYPDGPHHYYAELAVIAANLVITDKRKTATRLVPS